MQLAKNGPTIPKPKASKKVKPPTVPEKNLVVQHNISQNGFQHADELGGLAAPSIAVAHKDMPMNDFGDITLLAHPSLIDPKSKVPVFSADAYTPRQPRAEYKVNEKEAYKLTKELRPHSEETASYPDFENKIRREGITGALDNRNIRTSLGLAYLKEKGRHHEALNAALAEGAKGGNYDTGFLNILSSKLHPYKDKDKSDLYNEDKNINQLIEEAGNEYASQLAETYKQKDLGPDFDADKIAKDSAKRQVTIYQRRPIANILKEVKEASGPKIDKYTYGSKVNELIENDPEFKTWAEKKLAPLQGDKYLPKYSEYSGALRRMPYNMNNILKAMKLSKLKGTEEGMLGLDHIRGGGVKQFRSLDDIKKHGQSIVSKEDRKKYRGEMDDLFHTLSTKIQNETGDFGSMDAIAHALKDSMGRGKYLHQTLKENGLDGVSPETIREAQIFKQKLLDMPAEYFEAKPKRGVGFHEFKAAAVPDDAPQHIVDRLHRHGLTTERYKKGDNEDRKRAIQKLAQEHDLMLSEKEFFTPLERIRKYIR